MNAFTHPTRLAGAPPTGGRRLLGAGMATRAQGPRDLPGRAPVARESRLPRPARRHPGCRLHLGAASRRFVRVGLPSPSAPGTPPAPRHCPWVVGAWVLGVVAAVVLGIVLAGAVVVGTPTGAVVVGAGTRPSWQAAGWRPPPPQ